MERNRITVRRCRKETSAFVETVRGLTLPDRRVSTGVVPSMSASPRILSPVAGEGEVNRLKFQGPPSFADNPDRISGSHRIQDVQGLGSPCGGALQHEPRTHQEGIPEGGAFFLDDVLDEPYSGGPFRFPSLDGRLALGQGLWRLALLPRFQKQGQELTGFRRRGRRGGRRRLAPSPHHTRQHERRGEPTSRHPRDVVLSPTMRYLLKRGRGHSRPTSLPALVPTARHTRRSMVSETNFTAPSPTSKFTPPGCALLAVLMIRPGGYMQDS